MVQSPPTNHSIDSRKNDEVCPKFLNLWGRAKKAPKVKSLSPARIDSSASSHSQLVLRKSYVLNRKVKFIVLLKVSIIFTSNPVKVPSDFRQKYGGDCTKANVIWYPLRFFVLSGNKSLPCLEKILWSVKLPCEKTDDVAFRIRINQEINQEM